MRFFLAILALVSAAFSSAPAAERVILYAALTEGQLVTLTDGTQWQMDKDDCFPVVAYKERQTKVILQLAGAQFMVSAAKTKVVTEKDLPKAIEKYRVNVNTYINSYAARWRSQAEGEKQPE